MPMNTITSEMIDGARLLLAEQFAHLPDNEIESVFVSHLNTMEADTAQILQGIAGVVGALAPTIGQMVCGRTGRTISTAGQAIGTIGQKRLETL